MKSRSELDGFDCSGNTALDWAAGSVPTSPLSSRTGCVRLLLERGASLGAVASDGWTPLHLEREMAGVTRHGQRSRTQDSSSSSSQQQQQPAAAAHSTMIPRSMPPSAISTAIVLGVFVAALVLHGWSMPQTPTP